MEREYGNADRTYYNVGILTPDEIINLDNLDIGSVIVMTPTDNEHYTGAEAESMVIDGAVKIVSMPGVGSSSVGCAAFAKHIASIRREPVAGIVVGEGDSSVWTEGPEGYFIGRPSNILGIYYPNTASQKLVDLYIAGARPNLLAGHSKGDMDIANALFKMRNDQQASLYEGVTFKTFGCGVLVPSGVNLQQYIGTADALGTFNTVNWLNMTYAIGRYHTTNPFYAFTYLPIERYL